MVAEAMTEAASGEDTRDGSLVSQVARTGVRARKAHSLIGRVYDPRNLARAWERVRENRGAGGRTGSVLTGSGETTGDTSRFCINGLGTEATVPSWFVGWR